MRFLLLLTLLVGLYFIEQSALNTLLRFTCFANYTALVSLFYWGISGFIYISSLTFFVKTQQNPKNSAYQWAYTLFGVYVLVFIPKLILALTSLLLLIAQVISNESQTLILYIGFGISLFMFLAILHGIIWGKYNFKIHEVIIASDKIPKEFDGYHIAQFSDMHIGSFNGAHQKVIQGIKMINSLNADLILFTGDLVNNLASETNGWESVLDKLKAKDGIFAILGNHDYGDYFRFESASEKKENIEALIRFQEKIGFKLLLNEHIKIQKSNALINIIGVENWGTPPFPQYGNLKKATEGVDTDNFSILMSHDPSHWKQEVLEKTNIHLTLSGHTHGMQFGFELGKFKWSPVKLKYPEWAGLYQKNNQFLYVNRGFGFIGFPGRVGIWPEITSIKLQHKST